MNHDQVINIVLNEVKNAIPGHIFGPNVEQSVRNAVQKVLSAADKPQEPEKKSFYGKNK